MNRSVGVSWFLLDLVPALRGGLCFPNKDSLGMQEGKLPSWLAVPFGGWSCWLVGVHLEVWVPDLLFFSTMCELLHQNYC